VAETTEFHIYCTQWLKWDLACGGTLKFCIGAMGKNDSPWDNILSIMVQQYFLGQECRCGTKYHLFKWYL